MSTTLSTLARMGEAATEASAVPTWAFGAFAFGALAVALWVVTMINVDR